VKVATLLLVVVSATSIVVVPDSALASGGDGDGTFGGDGSSATIGVWAGAGTVGEPFDANDPDGPRRWTRRVTPDPGDPGDPIAGICSPGADPVTGLPQFGWWYTIETINTTIGNVVATRRVCIAFDPASPGIPPPPPIADPPTYGEIWRAATIAPPQIGVNPTIEGVTGLSTRLWATSADSVAISVSIRGYTATGSATRTEFWFAPGDATSTVRSNDGGTAIDPALEHVYERRGDYVLRAGALWVGQVTVTGPDIPTTTIDLGSALLVVARDYHVVEVRSVVVE
jgi:hypothetical protein